MVGAIEGGAVLVLLSAFFAHMLAPAVAAIRRRVRIGPRQRPISRPLAIVLLYLAIFVPAALLWRSAQDDAVHWVRVTAPRSVERLFTGGNFEPFERLIARAPVSALARRGLVQRLERIVSYVEREVRSTLNDLIAAARYAEWLAVTPILAFVLLTAAPGFQRSTLRVLPRGHLQWRAEEYLRDVNSALAGYVRAQVAAALIVGLACVAGFVLIGVPSAVSLGVAAGVLELVPAIGPLTALIVAGSQAGRPRARRDCVPRRTADHPGLCDLSAPDSPRHAHADDRRYPDDLDRRGARRRRGGDSRHPRRRIPVRELAALAGVSRDRTVGAQPAEPGRITTIGKRGSTTIDVQTANRLDRSSS
jgi:hypothetical protein